MHSSLYSYFYFNSYNEIKIKCLKVKQEKFASFWSEISSWNSSKNRNALR